MFHMTFVHIGVFDWLLGWHKGSIFVKMFKNFLLRNNMDDEAKLGILAWDITLYKSYVFFISVG